MGYFNFENSPSKKTPISAENLLAMQKGLMELVFPIGSTYITQSDTNPNTILNFGTWERLKGKVCLGLDENDDDLKTIGNTGGEKEHKLTVDELAEHYHRLAFDGGTGTGNIDKLVSNSFGEGRWYSNTESVGGNQPHNNMQPYEVVGYMWIRRS